MAENAGSAIGQGAGKFSNIDNWFPSDRRRKWFLLCGATDPPGEIEVSNRRTGPAGKFLNSTRDLGNVEGSAVKAEIFNAIREYNLSKTDATRKIIEFAKYCRDKDCQPVLYYSGHGETATGDWVFFDGTISLDDIVLLFLIFTKTQSGGPVYPLIISDACYSGAWANVCCHVSRTFGLRIHCLSACTEFQTAFDLIGK